MAAYAVRAWPTLTVVDPDGYVAAQLSGEGTAHAIRALLDDLITEHDAKGTLHRGDGPYVPPPPPQTPLRFPSKGAGAARRHVPCRRHRHRSLAVLADDLDTVLRRIDGFVEPQGMCLLPPSSRRTRATTCWSPTLRATPCAGWSSTPARSYGLRQRPAVAR
jgi:hypothetical protein